MFEAAGPILYAVLAAWVVVLAGVLDRAVYAAGCAVRRPWGRVARLAASGDVRAANALAHRERARAERGLARIEAVSQLATSIGLFGTVVGIARAFFARGPGGGIAPAEALASGLSTALYTTIAGLAVFLVGQTAVILYREWLAHCQREARTRLARNTDPFGVEGVL